MTDYRLRNHDLLYADRGRSATWRMVAIFGSIGFTVTLGVAAYLVDQFNPAGTGFNTTPPSVTAQRPSASPVVSELARRPATRSGS